MAVLCGLVLAATGAAVDTAGADTTTSNIDVFATLTGTSQVNVALPGPITGLLEGSKVHLRAEIKTGQTGNIYSMAARLCKPSVDAGSPSKFDPTKFGNCVPAPFSPADDDYATVDTDAPNKAADLDFRVGSGSQSFTSTLGGPTTITCDATHPCSLWIDLSVDTTTSSTGHAYKHFNLTYLNRTFGDFDGSHTTDVAVFRPSTGSWYVQGGVTTNWGTSGDIAVPADYNGDGKAEIAVFRPSTGQWYVNGGPTTSWGTSGDVPAPGDYDGNGTADVAVFRPSTGQWYVNGGPTTSWGTSGDVPV